MGDHIKSKQAIVLGGGGGIGSQVVRQLAVRGCKVLAASMDGADKLAALAAETGAECIELDVTDRAAVMERLQPRTADFLVLAHGALGRSGTLFDQPAESTRRLVDVNILGVQNCLQAVVPGMIARNSGHVVLLGSVALYPSLGQPIYSATKAAVHSMASNLRMELYPAQVKVTEVRPGRVRTGMHAEMFAVAEIDAGGGVDIADQQIAVGIDHRDLKAQNLLLAEQGGRLLAYLIDLDGVRLVKRLSQRRKARYSLALSRPTSRPDVRRKACGQVDHSRSNAGVRACRMALSSVW